MPKAAQLESGRAGTRLKVCLTPPPGSVPLPLSSHVWPWTGAAPPSPLFPSPRQLRAGQTLKGVKDVSPEVLPGPWVKGVSFEVLGLRPGRLPWTSRRQGEVPLKAERGRVWGLEWEEEVGGVEKSSRGAGTCFLLSALLLTWSVKGKGSPGYDTVPPRAPVSSSVRGVQCGLCLAGLTLLNPLRQSIQHIV